MAFYENTYPASFRGISFLARNENTTRGKKIVIHEYPNSDDRYVEELGKLPPIFEIEAIVHGKDATARRESLQNALELPGLGEFVHPIEGIILVKATEFSVNSNQTEIGQHVFQIRFAKSRENITPEPSAPTETAVKVNAENARNSLNDKLEEIYKEPRIKFNFDSTVETLQNVFDKVHSVINPIVDLSTSGAAQFNRVYRTVTNNITSIVSSAQTLRENISLFYTSALDAGSFIEQLDSAWTNLLEYPLIISTSSPISLNQSENEQNKTAIVEHLKLTALVNAYESGIYSDYTTDDDLELARKRLDTSYRAQLSEANDDISAVNLVSIASDGEVRSRFSDLRVSARKVFDQKKKAVFRIVTINPRLSSMALTSFRYYGNLDYIDQLAGLNPAINHSNFNATIKALSK